MVVPSHPLARPPAGAEVRSLPVERVSQAILFSHLRAADLMMPEGTLIPVRLVPDFMAGGWRVNWDFGTIGSLPADVRAQFPDIERIHAARQEPLAWARVCTDSSRGLLDVTVDLPAPELIVPRDSLIDARILPQGSPLPATLGGPDRQVLGKVSGTDVLVDGEVVAELEFVPLAALEEGPLLARVFVIGGRSFVDVGVGEVAEITALPEYEPPAPVVPEPVFDPHAPWGVTMEFAEMAEPNPAGTRTVDLTVVDSSHVDP